MIVTPVYWWFVYACEVVEIHWILSVCKTYSERNVWAEWNDLVQLGSGGCLRDPNQRYGENKPSAKALRTYQCLVVGGKQV